VILALSIGLVAAVITIDCHERQVQATYRQHPSADQTILELELMAQKRAEAKP